ncbi:MAG: hypothetical protein L6R37_002328 [Teloschistes peruensis]|nr:MAG: hypothetical protein L6R37_002328 [Teloschistes peruensis]
MSTPSSSSREFVPANVSPERNGSSSASGSDWHSAQEHLESEIRAVTLIFQSKSQANNNSDPESTNDIESDESSHDIESDSEPTITLPTNNIPQLVMPSPPSPISGSPPPSPPAARPDSDPTPSPPPRPYRPYQTFPGDLSSATPLPSYTPAPNPTANFNRHLPTHNPLTGRPYYDNRTPNVPSHFVPLYGAAYGMFYEMPVEPDTADEQQQQQALSNHRLGYQPTDALHLQPRAVTAPAAAARRAAAEEEGSAPIGQRFYYCACVNRWSAERHDCPAEAIGEPVGEARMPPLGTVPSGVIRPGDAVLEEEMTHEIRVGYLGYLTPEQREQVRRDWGI